MEIPTDSTTSHERLRETPATLFPKKDDPAFPDVGDPEADNFEEELDVNNIQGNVIPGFSKDFQTLLVLQINRDQVGEFRRWLNTQVRFIATAAEVVAFNRLFKEVRFRRCTDTGAVKSTWVNVHFSYNALKLLVPEELRDHDFVDVPFKNGLRKQSEDGVLGDPQARDAEGNPHNWILGGFNSPRANVAFVVASDDEGDMRKEVSRIEQSLFNFKTRDQKPVIVATIAFKEEGANLTPPLAGHEHFGNLDGVSQPGVRGRVSDDGHDVLTPRQNPEEVDDDGNRTQGKPGQDLLWPGEFVFGYPGQDPKAKKLEKSKGEIRKAVEDVAPDEPHWTDNGSLLVIRRLRQDVFKLHEFIHNRAEDLGIDPLLLSSKLFGRWESGAPTVRNPREDNPDMAADDCANNDFEFNAGQGNGEQDTADTISGPNDCQDHFPEDEFPKDDATDPNSDRATGNRCPFIAHTRKAYPRNDLTPAGPDDPDKSEVNTQTHRLLRRGIPFGAVSRSTPDEPVEDLVNRGLHFLAYQTSIEKQFEFVIGQWVNNPDFSTEAATDHECAVNGNQELPLGHDPVIGQNEGKNGDRTRFFFVKFQDQDGNDQCVKLTTSDDWVIPTGGGYFFAPSIVALQNVLSISDDPEEKC